MLNRVLGYGLVTLVMGVLLTGVALAEEPEDAVEAFHTALVGQDREAVLALLVPEVVILESGGYEASREEYAAHHLAGDMEFSASTESTVERSWSGRHGDVAWVLRSASTKGNFRGREIDSRGVETMVLKQVDGQWRIAHVHWSSRSGS